MPFLASAFREKFVSHSLLPCAASILPPRPWYPLTSPVAGMWNTAPRIAAGALRCSCHSRRPNCARVNSRGDTGWADGLCRQTWHAGSSFSYRSSPAPIALCCCMMRYEKCHSLMNCILLLSPQQSARYFSKTSYHITLFLSENPAHYKENQHDSSGFTAILEFRKQHVPFRVRNTVDYVWIM